MGLFGNNIRDVCFKNDTDLHSLHTVSIGEMNNNCFGIWSESVNDEDKRVGMQVLELVIERDKLNEWLFDRGEISIVLIFDVSCSNMYKCILFCWTIFMF